MPSFYLAGSFFFSEFFFMNACYGRGDGLNTINEAVEDEEEEEEELDRDQEKAVQFFQQLLRLKGRWRQITTY